MSEIDYYMSKYYRALVEEREREIALYESGARTLEGRGNDHLVDVTDERLAELKTECAWYESLIAKREHRAPTGS